MSPYARSPAGLSRRIALDGGVGCTAVTGPASTSYILSRANSGGGDALVMAADHHIRTILAGSRWPSRLALVHKKNKRGVYCDRPFSKISVWVTGSERRHTGCERPLALSVEATCPNRPLHLFLPYRGCKLGRQADRRRKPGWAYRSPAPSSSRRTDALRRLIRSAHRQPILAPTACAAGDPATTAHATR